MYREFKFWFPVLILGVRKLADLGKSVYYYENTEGGHGGAADNKQRAFMSTLVYTFLHEALAGTMANVDSADLLEVAMEARDAASDASGASAGAICAAFLAIHTDAESQ